LENSQRKSWKTPLSTSALRTVVFDIETKKLADEVGGWANLKRGDGGISVLVLWDSATGRFHIYDQNTLDEAARHLEDADVVLSFNGEKFDREVIEGILGRRLCLRQHYDLLLMIWDSLPCRQKGHTLGEVGERTLNQKKSGESNMAPALFNQGRFAELHDYCLADVHLTRRLFQFVQKEGGVIGVNGSILLLPLPDWFEQVNLG
jgi:DEAD/DEAH box helicase domain-containing protein